MFTTDLVYLVSFLIFASLAYKLGKKNVVPLLKEGIAKLVKALDIATLEQEKALSQLHDARKILLEFELGCEEREKKLQDKTDFLLQKHQEVLHTLIEKKEQTFFEQIAYTRILKMNELKASVLDATIHEILNVMQNNPKVAQAFNERSMNLIKDELLTQG
jgi:F0F1-type ATP synthase membrane subunit b/b'